MKIASQTVIFSTISTPYMNRRELLLRPFRAAANPGGNPGKTDPPGIDGGRVEARTSTGLAAYTGAWDYAEAAHLLRRCLFGPTQSQIDAVKQMGLNSAITMLTAPLTAPAPPVNSRFANDPDVPVGSSWVDAPLSNGVNGYRRNSLIAWWAGQMVEQGLSLTEKMTLFWHNHFATELDIYQDARYGYKHLALLRAHALGNFKTLVEEITIDPAMLRYLNGNQNIVGRANENYARELFELFTIGKGPQVGPGNYTTYTEQDVIEAAKVLTGWLDRVNRTGPNANVRSEFIVNRHDTSTKQFSAAFNNQTIANNGADEYKDLIDMIFSKIETAKFICRKLYRWFVYYTIDAQVEQDIIDPLASLLVNSNFEIKPVLETLFKSEHFFDTLNQGCIIKNPMDYTISLVRQFEVEIPDPATDLEGQYRVWQLVAEIGAVQQMYVLNPPSVAGWPAYYQEPLFHEGWITSATLGTRSDYAKAMVYTGLGNRRGGMIIDPIAFLGVVSDPSDPNVLIGEWSKLLFPQPLLQSQLDFFKEALIPGLPDYEWTIEYSDFLLNPNDQLLRDAIIAKLRALLVTMLSMAEYHLS